MFPLNDLTGLRVTPCAQYAVDYSAHTTPHRDRTRKHMPLLAKSKALNTHGHVLPLLAKSKALNTHGHTGCSARQVQALNTHGHTCCRACQVQALNTRTAIRGSVLAKSRH